MNDYWGYPENNPPNTSVRKMVAARLRSAFSIVARKKRGSEQSDPLLYLASLKPLAHDKGQKYAAICCALAIKVRFSFYIECHRRKRIALHIQIF